MSFIVDMGVGTAMLGVLTVEGREAMLDQTLWSLKASDWPGRPYIQIDGNTYLERSQDRITANTKDLLEAFMDTSTHYLVLLEDDVAVNLWLHFNLSNWSPVLGSELLYGTLCNSNIRTTEDCPTYSLADPDALYGGQGLVLHRDLVSVVLRFWDREIGMPDVRIPQIAKSLVYGMKFYIHKPSLVQHLGAGARTWAARGQGGVEPRAIDFSQTWRCCQPEA